MTGQSAIDLKTVFYYGAVMTAVVLLSAVVIYLIEQHEGSTVQEVNALLAEHNVPLTVRDCTAFATGYICDVDAEINIPDTNKDIRFVATSQAIITEEGNTLYIVKVTPYLTTNAPEKHEIPTAVKDALSELTLVVSDEMYCLRATDNEYLCYIPTNMAPMGNATLYYAPLFYITLDGDRVKEVVVYV